MISFDLGYSLRGASGPTDRLHSVLEVSNNVEMLCSVISKTRQTYERNFLAVGEKMFGFGKKPDHFTDLMEHLVERSGMRTRFASAFLSAYKDDVSKRFEEGTKRAEQALRAMSQLQQMMFNPTEVYDFAIVAQAYVAYLQDLRRGRHVGTDIEIAIWGLLVTHIDLVEQTDKALASWIDKEHEKQFPKLLETVYT